jgi:hypothetical protein
LILPLTLYAAEEVVLFWLRVFVVVVVLLWLVLRSFCYPVVVRGLVFMFRSAPAHGLRCAYGLLSSCTDRYVILSHCGLDWNRDCLVWFIVQRGKRAFVVAIWAFSAVGFQFIDGKDGVA